MSDYLGVVIAQSLRHPGAISLLQVVARRQIGSWLFLLVTVPAAGLLQHLAWMQGQLVTDDSWFAHYFREDELVVVYRDAVFFSTLEPDTWGPAIAHGLAAGIPREQLNFTPCTAGGAYARIGAPAS